MNTSPNLQAQFETSFENSIFQYAGHKYNARNIIIQLRLDEIVEGMSPGRKWDEFIQK